VFLYTWDNKKGTVMPDLRIKPNIDNGDLPEDFDGHSVEKLHKVIDRKIKILEDSNKLQLMDIFNPALLRDKFENINGHTNKDKDKQ